MAFQKFLELGSEIILCSENCEGVVNEKERGIIPRTIILSTLSGEVTKEKAQLGIFGINPGSIPPFERLYYKEILSKFGKKNAVRAFSEIHKIWISEFIKSYKNYDKKIQYYKYFINTMHFINKALEDKVLKEILNPDPFLWGEIVYCQRSEKNLPSETKSKCIENFLGRVLEFISGKVILCLGRESYEIMKKIAEGKKAE